MILVDHTIGLPSFGRCKELKKLKEYDGKEVYREQDIRNVSEAIELGF